jgi:hypothetical protein
LRAAKNWQTRSRENFLLFLRSLHGGRDIYGANVGKFALGMPLKFGARGFYISRNKVNRDELNTIYYIKRKKEIS